jgi:hypothetical protein
MLVLSVCGGGLWCYGTMEARAEQPGNVASVVPMAASVAPAAASVAPAATASVAPAAAAGVQSTMIPQDVIVVRDVPAGQSLPVTYSIRISKDFDRIKLKGSMSSELDQKTLIGLVKASFPSATIINRVKIKKSSADRDVKIGGLSFALKLLGYVETGSASVDDNGVAIDGSASTAVILNEVKKTLANDRPTGVPIKSIRIAPPTKSWTASVTKDGTLTLSGVMPDESSKQIITKAAGRMFRECDLIDGTGVNTRLPERWMKGALHALELLRLLDNGSVEITDQSIRLKGDAPSETAVQMIDARSADIPNGFSMNSEVTAPGRPGVAAISADETVH